MKTENNIEPQNIESYIVKSIQILNKSKKIY